MAAFFVSLPPCLIGVEARGAPTAGGFVSFAVPTMRMQSEATTRSAWLLFAANDADVALAGGRDWGCGGGTRDA